MNNSRISILECTLRDGGLALEDEAKYLNDVNIFTLKDRSDIACLLALSNVDFIELGSIEISVDDKTGFAIYQSIEDISKILPVIPTKSRYTALFRGPDTPLDQIPEYNPSLCEYIRVIIRYSELIKSIEFCAALSRKGYKVFVQPMVTLRYTNKEIDYMIKACNDMNAFALYFVDSYGYMIEEDVKRLFTHYDNILASNILIGFHAHNNLNLAFSNVIWFINYSSNRSIVVDSTSMGMGQGAGNLQTELLSIYLNDNYSTEYDYASILDICEIIERYTTQSLWGYSVSRMLSAINKSAYKISIELRRKYGLKYKDIHHILRNCSDEFRHRYTPQGTIELLKIFGDRNNLT